MKVQTAEFVLSAVAPSQLIRDGLPAIAFVGRSNVGKSTVLNRLLGRKGLARTSSTPGRTQAVNYFLVNRRLYFVDLPGYGYAKAARTDRRRWAAMAESYLQQSEPSPLVVALIDGKVGATPLDRQAYDYFIDLGLEVLVVTTKIDKVTKGRRPRMVAEVRRALALPDSRPVLTLSAISGEGVKELWRELEAFLNAGRQRQP